MIKSETGGYVTCGEEIDVIKEWLWVGIIQMSFFQKIKFVYRIIFNKVPKVGIFK